MGEPRPSSTLCAELGRLKMLLHRPKIFRSSFLGRAWFGHGPFRVYEDSNVELRYGQDLLMGIAAVFRSFRHRARCRYISSQIGSSSLLPAHSSSKSSICSSSIACRVAYSSGKGCVTFFALNTGDNIRFVCAHPAKQLP